MNVAHMPSINGHSRRDKIGKIIIHAMAEFIDIEPYDYHAVQWLEKLGLSAHALISPSGVVIRTRDDNQVAFHAKGFNNNSLGVEVLVPGLHTYHSFTEAIKTDWVTKEAWDALLELVDSWQQKHKILSERIFRHSDLSPDRKVDPGSGFRWEGFLKDLQFRGKDEQS